MINRKNTNLIYIVLSFCVGVFLTIHVNKYLLGGASAYFPRFNSASGESERKDDGSSEKMLLSFDIHYVEERFTSLEQTDPQLIQYTRARFLTPPSTKTYNLAEKVEATPLTEWVLKFFGEKRNGVFIEAGAYDGEYGSNTLYLEKVLGWKGVLIECNPVLVPDIISKHRKAWVGNVCLSPASTPGRFNFRFPTNYGVAGTLLHEVDEQAAKRPTKFLDVQAVPLYTLLAALGWKEIDFFSFDIEGIEFDLLKHFPFDKVMFKVIIMEIQYYSTEQRVDINKLFAKNGYVFVKHLEIDHIYVHKSVQHMIPSES